MTTKVRGLQKTKVWHTVDLLFFYLAVVFALLLAVAVFAWPHGSYWWLSLGSSGVASVLLLSWPYRRGHAALERTVQLVKAGDVAFLLLLLGAVFGRTPSTDGDHVLALFFFAATLAAGLVLAYVNEAIRNRETLEQKQSTDAAVNTVVERLDAIEHLLRNHVDAQAQLPTTRRHQPRPGRFLSRFLSRPTK